MSSITPVDGNEADFMDYHIEIANYVSGPQIQQSNILIRTQDGIVAKGVEDIYKELKEKGVKIGGPEDIGGYRYPFRFATPAQAMNAMTLYYGYESFTGSDTTWPSERYWSCSTNGKVLSGTSQTRILKSSSNLFSLQGP